MSEVELLNRELEDQHQLNESLRIQQMIQSKEIDRLRNLFLSSVGTEPTQDAMKSIQASSAFYAASKGKIAWLTNLLERGADIHQRMYILRSFFFKKKIIQILTPPFALF